MLDELREALKATGIPFAHYAWATRPDGDYGVWGEDSSKSLWADGRMSERIAQGTVDLFADDDEGFSKELVERALDSIGCSWYLNSIQYEDDTRLLHYEWVFEVA